MKWDHSASVTQVNPKAQHGQMSELSQNNCNGNWTDSFGRMTCSLQLVTFIDFLKTILLFLPEPFRASHPLPSPRISLRTAHGAFDFINSHLRSRSATQWIHYFLFPLTACSSFWLFFTFPATHTFYNKGKPTKCLTNKILPPSPASSTLTGLVSLDATSWFCDIF